MSNVADLQTVDFTIDSLPPRKYTPSLEHDVTNFRAAAAGAFKRHPPPWQCISQCEHDCNTAYILAVTSCNCCIVGFGEDNGMWIKTGFGAFKLGKVRAVVVEGSSLRFYCTDDESDADIPFE